MHDSEAVYRAAIKDACTGVTGTVIGQGMAFPMWGQELIGVCRVAKDTWLYGGKPADIVHTITQGTAKGMPAFQANLSPTQIAQLAAFVHGLGGGKP